MDELSWSRGLVVSAVTRGCDAYAGGVLIGFPPLLPVVPFSISANKSSKSPEIID